MNEFGQLLRPDGMLSLFTNEIFEVGQPIDIRGPGELGTVDEIMAECAAGYRRVKSVDAPLRYEVSV